MTEAEVVFVLSLLSKQDISQLSFEISRFHLLIFTPEAIHFLDLRYLLVNIVSLRGLCSLFEVEMVILALVKSVKRARGNLSLERAESCWISLYEFSLVVLHFC